MVTMGRDRKLNTGRQGEFPYQHYRKEKKDIGVAINSKRLPADNINDTVRSTTMYVELANVKIPFR